MEGKLVQIWALSPCCNVAGAMEQASDHWGFEMTGCASAALGSRFLGIDSNDSVPAKKEVFPSMVLLKKGVSGVS